MILVIDCESSRLLDSDATAKVSKRKHSKTQAEDTVKKLLQTGQNAKGPGRREFGRKRENSACSCSKIESVQSTD